VTQSKASPIYLPTNQSLIPSCHTEAHLQYWLTLYTSRGFREWSASNPGEDGGPALRIGRYEAGVERASEHRLLHEVYPEVQARSSLNSRITLERQKKPGVKPG